MNLSSLIRFSIPMSAMLILIGLYSCDDDTPIPINEEELITTLIVTFTENGTVNTFVLRSEDTNGDGIVDIASADTLPANTTFNVALRVRNDIDNEEITTEVLAESDEHLFCFDPVGLNLTLAASDMDGNGDPIGLEAVATTGTAGMGSLNVQLKHEPNKSAIDPCATGEADVNYTFTGMVIQ